MPAKWNLLAIAAAVVSKLAVRATAIDIDLVLVNRARSDYAAMQQFRRDRVLDRLSVLA